MRVLESVISVEFNNYYNDDCSIQVAYNRGAVYPWEIYDGGSEEFDVYTTDGLRSKVDAILTEYGPCPDEYHDEDHDDYDHDASDCEYERHVDCMEAWRTVLSACLQFEATGKVETNLGTALRNTLSGQVNVETRYPGIYATINFSDTRLAIRESVSRALEGGGIHQATIDQFRFECDTAPDPIAVAREWVSVS